MYTSGQIRSTTHETKEVVVRGAKHKRIRNWNAIRKKNISQHDEFKQKKQNEELATGMVVAALEQIGYTVKEEVHIITKIPDDQDIANLPFLLSKWVLSNPIAVSKQCLEQENGRGI